MKTKAIYYHAGCPVCVEAERGVAQAIDRDRYDLEVVHLGEEGNRIEEAESAGVRSVPALALGDQVFHINFGAELSALKD
ncbi:thioredoxin family protein [Pelagicoccus sp. SDUM812003]|uniref:thioredoxin family protein n=1 Tax=Pelagicoccus sp. SDUM812003 TaxID=3041267 RepID=UPI0028105661|nr:thioredoxin family protein [Pelagicoccus sp. SDUM812003]MDQ8205622.1 thioredoxin family protein [Pelagicoccus sp. SDUM812003]